MAGVDVSANGEEIHDLRSLLASDERDFLIRNNGDQVIMSNLDGKTIGLYFSASWCGPCRNFTPKLVEAYNEIASKGNEFEVVFITSDKDEDAFHAYFSKMPWLAIPFSDAKTCGNLKKLFKVRGIPHLVVLDGSGKVLSTDVVGVISEHGSEVYPFTPERITKIREDEEAAKREQTLRSVLASPSRDYLISNNSSRVPISDLEGKTVGLYFFISRSKSCHEFTPKLAATCSKLEEKGENFEIVLVPLDEKESSFEESFTNMPWLAIPFGDRSCEKLARYFEIRSIPTLAVIGPDGKTLVINATDLVEEHGVEAFPFSPEKLEELVEKEKMKLESQTLESLLVFGKLDYVIGTGGNKVSVSELVGKNILLYFSAQWCGPCRAFLPKLIELYHKIKKMDNAFEIIFISSDSEEKSYEDFFASMPWLALPFGDERKKVLSRRFKIRGIPSLVAIGSTGRTVTHDAKKLLVIHGADAYPFNEEKIKELDARVEEMAKAWPKKVNHQLHEAHELILTRQSSYGCDGCGELGYGWSYHCSECDFDLHPMCVLKEEKDGLEAEEKEGQVPNKEGYVCDGDVCRRA